MPFAVTGPNAPVLDQPISRVLQAGKEAGGTGRADSCREMIPLSGFRLLLFYSFTCTLPNIPRFFPSLKAWFWFLQVSQIAVRERRASEAWFAGWMGLFYHVFFFFFFPPEASSPLRFPGEGQKGDEAQEKEESKKGGKAWGCSRLVCPVAMIRYVMHRPVVILCSHVTCLFDA